MFFLVTHLPIIIYPELGPARSSRAPGSTDLLLLVRLQESFKIRVRERLEPLEKSKELQKHEKRHKKIG